MKRTITPGELNKRAAEFTVIDVRRKSDYDGNVILNAEWHDPDKVGEWAIFAPWYGPRPDDTAFLEEDKKRPDAVAALQADAQGPHETTIRAGEERILTWSPDLMNGGYTVRARLIYTLNRYAERKFTENQTEIYSTVLPITVTGGK